MANIRSQAIFQRRDMENWVGDDSDDDEDDDSDGEADEKGQHKGRGRSR